MLNNHVKILTLKPSKADLLFVGKRTCIKQKLLKRSKFSRGKNCGLKNIPFVLLSFLLQKQRIRMLLQVWNVLKSIQKV